MLGQFSWAARMPDAKQLTAEKLARAIDTAMSDTSLGTRAAAFGEKIRAEKGIARAVEVIERYARDYKPGVGEG